jgi:hypothetical protein
MQNHYYDNTHPLHPYTYSLDAMPGTLPPANALRGDKPTVPAGYWPSEKDGRWIDIEDHRGEEGYVNGSPFTILDFGTYPSGWSITPPELTDEEKTGLRRAEINAIFAQIDADSIRPLRAIANGEGCDDDRKKLAELAATATALREELTRLA